MTNIKGERVRYTIADEHAEDCVRNFNDVWPDCNAIIVEDA